MQRMLTIVCYDISAPPQRRRLFGLLSQSLRRVQGSVFEGRLSKKERTEIYEAGRQFLDAGDSLRLYCVSDHELDECLCAGDGFPPMASDHLILS